MTPGTRRLHVPSGSRELTLLAREESPHRPGDRLPWPLTSPRQEGSLGIRRTAAWSNRQPRGRRRREHPPSSRRCAPRHTGGQRPGRRHGCGRALVCGPPVKSPLWYGPGLCDERSADDGSTRRRASSVEAVGLPRRSSLRAHSRSAPSAHMLVLQR